MAPQIQPHHITTWNLLKVLPAGSNPAGFTEVWKCAMCHNVHHTFDDKSGWTHCPTCGCKISKRLQSSPIDRIFNMFLAKNIPITKIVVDITLSRTALVYLCYSSTPFPIAAAEDVLTPILFDTPRGLPPGTDYKVIWDKKLPKKEDNILRFEILDPLQYPRWTDEVTSFKEGKVNVKKQCYYTKRFQKLQRKT